MLGVDSIFNEVKTKTLSFSSIELFKQINQHFHTLRDVVDMSSIQKRELAHGSALEGLS